MFAQSQHKQLPALLLCCFIILLFTNTCNGQTLRNQNQLKSGIYQTYSSPKYGSYDVYYFIIPKNSLVKIDIGSSDGLMSYFRLNAVPTQTLYDSKYRCGSCYYSNTFSSNTYGSNSSLSYHTLYVAVAAERTTYYSYGITGYTFPSDYLIKIDSGKSITATIPTVESWAFYQIMSSSQMITIERGLEFGFEFYSQEFPSTNYVNTIYEIRLNTTGKAIDLGSYKYIAVVNRGKNQTLSKNGISNVLNFNNGAVFHVESEENKRDHYPFQTYKFSIATNYGSFILDGSNGSVNSLIIIVYFIPFVCCCVVCGCCCYFMYRIKRSN